MMVNRHRLAGQDGTYWSGNPSTNTPPPRPLVPTCCCPLLLRFVETNQSTNAARLNECQLCAVQALLLFLMLFLSSGVQVSICTLRFGGDMFTDSLRIRIKRHRVLMYIGSGTPTKKGTHVNLAAANNLD